MNQTISYDSVAHFYDSYVNTQFDVPFFLAEAKKAEGKVLELACGTGRLSLPLLRAGIDLTCVDYSEEMLAVFRNKLAGSGLSCRVVKQDMAELSLADRFNLIFIPFHSFSELLDRSKHAQSLTNIREHLAESGRFICTLHNPVVRTRSMDGTVKELGRFPSGEDRTLVVSTRFEYDDRSHVVHGCQFYELQDSDGALMEKKELPVSFYLFQRSEFEGLAAAAGFRIVQLFGTYERSAFDEATSPFMIWELEKA
jgi:SAM-dependent methyltransferase